MKALGVIGLHTKHLATVVRVTMPVGLMRRNACVNVEKLRKDGKDEIFLVGYIVFF